ncbi:A disintegrin and metalloproteinase with thrombospondin motifs 12-like [Copidosoma floridanum]|uniref:A disintegrin and metalloproteinase with thrombospondin motifs 12-like n=1 Tax=Copidosoma floridanum TaxID=29053 RepID=UPI0006C9418D|nr:A disintegrin and metalloproteinase with thrombospondin motifs 12-like [Copidosoma floridanum]
MDTQRPSIVSRFIIFYQFISSTLLLIGGKLDGYSPSPGDVYHGRYTRDILSGTAELLIPRRVHEDGSFRTYELPKFYEHPGNDERSRRSTGTGAVYLVLPFAGEDHHVELEPYPDFISPWLVIETRSVNKVSSLDGVDLRHASPQQCHYRGRVLQHANSRIALSLCDGVTGYLHMNQGRYFIEPLHGDEPDASGQHVHVIYKKEAPHETFAHSSDAFCGTSDDWEGAWTSRLQRTGTSAEAIEGERAVRGRQSASSGTHSIHRYIEVALVADRRFLDFHNGTNYELYLLTIMNMVSDFYHDASVGNQIDVVVVRMIYLERQRNEIDLHISTDGEKTLESFAKWVEKLNPLDPEHPNHFDVGVLVTRYDICAEGNNCNLLGLAYVAAACERKKAACITEDSGLLLSVVMAHEIGHILGCAHDTKDISGCNSQDKDGSYFVMSPIVFIFTIRWSSCSRKFITSFLESGLGDCLNNNPKNPPARYRYPNMLPGAMYDANLQCDLDYPGSKVCSFKSGECGNLWCDVGRGRCKSKGAPPADGTKCGENQWCIHKKCVEVGSRGDAAHGSWGNWGGMSKCSRTCGGGVRYSERECNNPAPENGGRYCIGERKKFSICNVNPCDASRPSFRAAQCAEFNKKNVLPGGPHQWEPFLRDDLEACSLYCINQARTFVKLSPTAKDGTPCKPGTYHVCISGVCRMVGCDWVIDSDAVEDVCGVCNGGGTQCAKVEGDYKDVGKPGYATIVKIPKGSKNIEIVENDEDENTLAVKLEKEKKYCLNGNLKEQKSGDYPCAGAVITYKHIKANLEEVYIKGPLKKAIELQVTKYIFYKSSNPGVHYKYYVDTPATSYVPTYSWEFVEWTDCDAKCGGGVKISEASCTEARAGKVAPRFCKTIVKPPPKSQTCNKAPCRAKWRVSQWSRCSGCGGKPGEMRRKIQCVRPGAHTGNDYVQANFDACKGEPPVQTRECIGAEPCRKPCSPSNVIGQVSLSPWLQHRMIDDLVDYGLVRYLEKSRAASEDGKQEEGNEFEVQMLKQWAKEEEAAKKEAKRACNATRFTTPVPGSIVVDSIPQSEIVVYEAPLVQDGTHSNMSDSNFQKQGDRALGGSLDKRHKKIHRGKEAIERLSVVDRHGGVNESVPRTGLAGCARRGRRRRRQAETRRNAQRKM